MSLDFIPLDRFVDLTQREEKYLICEICFGIYQNAVNSGCRHSFCKQCVKEWIDSNHSKCPKCKTQFTRKRRNEGRDENDAILIGDYIFNRDFVANGIISELKIKCSFDYNGCRKVIEFGLLSAHLKKCEHRICEICELAADPISPHNCIKSLKNANNKLKLKNKNNERKLKSMAEKNFDLKKQLKASKQYYYSSDSTTDSE